MATGLLIGCGTGMSARASVLDWDDEGYPSGSESPQVYNIDGITVTVDLSYDNWYYRSGRGGGWENPNPFNRPGGGSGGNPINPSVSNYYTGGYGNNTEALLLLVPETDYTNNGRLDSGFADEDSTLTITITFSSMVTEVDFAMFDIDYASNDYQDLITVTASDGVTTYLPSTTNSGWGAANQVLSDGVVQGTSGAAGNTDDGNAYFDFGGVEFNTITITYGNGNAAPTYPQGQGVSIYNINFTIVPEADVAWALLPLGLIAGAGWWRRRGAVIQA